MERFTLDLGHIFFIQTRSMGPIMIFNRQIVRRGTLDGSLMALCGVTYTEFPDLTGLNSEITLVPIADLVPFHSRTDAGLRVKRLKEPSSSAELVLVLMIPTNRNRTKATLKFAIQCCPTPSR